MATSLPKLAHTSLAQAVQLDLTPKASPEAGSSRCFWAGKGQPINPIGDPYAVYNDVFAGIMVGTPTNMGAEDPEIKKLMNKRKSLLDYVGKNLEAFKSRLGGEDKIAIEAHHTSVRDLEKQLQSGGSAPVGAGCAPVKGTMLNMGDRLQYPNILKAQMNLAIQGSSAASPGWRRCSSAIRRATTSTSPSSRASRPTAPATSRTSATTTTWATTRCSRASTTSASSTAG